MEQEFQLKMHGKLSILEQAQMKKEDRTWWTKRLEKHFEEQAKAQSGSKELGPVGMPGNRPPGAPNA